MTPRAVACAVLTLATLLGASCGHRVTPSFTFLQGRFSLTYDPATISESRIRQLARLAPYLDYEFVAPQLELCVDGDPRYLPCGTRSPEATNFLHNAEVNLNEGTKLLVFLDQAAPPHELEPVVRYLQGRLSYWLCLERARLDFHRAQDDALNRPCNGVNPAQECPDAIRRAQSATTASERHRRALYEWHNCMNEALTLRPRGYPEDAWRTFLRNYRIAETVTWDPVD